MKTMLRFIVLFGLPFIVLVAFYNFSFTESPRVYSAEGMWWETHKLLVFKPALLVTIHVSFMASMMLRMFINLERADKYLSRGIVILILSLLSYFVATMCDGWLLGYVGRLLRLVGFVLTMFAQACAIMMVVSAVNNKFN